MTGCEDIILSTHPNVESTDNLTAALIEPFNERNKPKLVT